MRQGPHVLLQSPPQTLPPVESPRPATTHLGSRPARVSRTPGSFGIDTSTPWTLRAAADEVTGGIQGPLFSNPGSSRVRLGTPRSKMPSSPRHMFSATGFSPRAAQHATSYTQLWGSPPTLTAGSPTASPLGQVASNRALLAGRNKGLAGESLSVGGGNVESALRDQWEELHAQRATLVTSLENANTTIEGIEEDKVRAGARGGASGRDETLQGSGMSSWRAA